jgi:hypothetical protein
VFLFAHGHFLIFPPLAALGAGLHVAAYSLEGEAEISSTGVVLSVLIPVALFILAIFLGYKTIGHRHMAEALERL